MDFSSVKTPCYIIDEDKLEENCKILKSVMDHTGCKILLAQKAFSCYGTYKLIGTYLSGTTASGVHEAKLGRWEMGIPYGKETHVFKPAYTQEEMDELLELCDHIVFNNLRQWKKFRDKVMMKRAEGKHIECGIRINPGYSEIDTPIYNPCFAGSRLGTTLSEFEKDIRFNPDILEGLDGLHFHSLCEQNSDALEHTLPYVEQMFGKYLKNMKWLNFGGGHHITRNDYDIETLEKCIIHMRDTYDVQVYLEPGEAVALNAGYLVSTVLDTGFNEINVAVLDTSAACHMPDVLEMPYRPVIIGAGDAKEKDFTYRLGGPTCLAGDIIGDYSFDEPLKEGDRLVFCDMAIYSMVKNNTFNGMNLPDILIYNEKNGCREYKSFGYEDFKRRV
ncbi:MAG: carboxynorspermidine decarboxylase [Lachnospiraceae bacterium]